MAFLRPEPASLRDRIANLSRREWIFAGVAVGLTAVIMTGFLIESRYGYPAPAPRLIYVESWPATRTIEETKADQAKALEEQRLAEIEYQKAQKARAEALKKLAF